jgi:PTS system beta-glucosides-specific IIC component
LTFFFGVTKDNDKPDATASDDTTRAGKDVASSVITSGQDSDTAVKTGVIETLGAPVSGTLVDVSEVADKVFASGALGSGIGIIPASSTVVAPLSGTLVTAFPTGHAYGIKSDNGVEVLIHIGIDTVALKGDGFNAHVTAGQKVAKGDTLATVDFEKVTSAGYDPTTIAVVTNTKKLASVTARPDGPVNAGDDAVTVEI